MLSIADGTKARPVYLEDGKIRVMVRISITFEMRSEVGYKVA